jgi:rhamnose transport system substrate-binding protein
VNYASKVITNARGQRFTAGKLGKFTVGAGKTILLGPPYTFDKSNVDKFNF